MFYLLIFESIGTSELMLIGLIALIVFGPRKLPELARTIGKTMADFRRSTEDFKQTWQQEILLEENKTTEKISSLSNQNIIDNEQTISRSLSKDKTEIIEPEIKIIDKDIFDEKYKSIEKENAELPKIAEKIVDKRDWL